MPITLLDVILLVVMLISALLAMVRGFMREVLSIASWAAAALLTLYSYPKLKPIVLQYFSNDIVAPDGHRGGDDVIGKVLQNNGFELGEPCWWCRLSPSRSPT